MFQMNRSARLLALAAVVASSLSLLACGSASTYDPITPSRIVAFGDALVDVGQTGRVDANNANTKYRFTVNQAAAGGANTSSTFIEAIAGNFGLGAVTYALDALVSSRLPSTGAYSYGEFGAMVSGAAGTKDARGCIKVAATATAYCAYNLQAQIDLFLSHGAPTANDLFVISIGTGDIMANGIRGMSITSTTPYAGLDDVQTALGGALTTTASINAQIQAAANALAVQVKRLTDAGAKYVLVVGPPNVGRSPWAAETGYTALLQNLSYATGSEYTSMSSEGLARIQATFGSTINNPVLFVETAGVVNTLTDGTNTTFANRSSAVCAATTNTSTTDTAKSIGTGVKPTAAVGATPAGRLTAALCTTDTLGGANPGTYVYADGVNFTPAMQNQIYYQALSKMRMAAWIN